MLLSFLGPASASQARSHESMSFGDSIAVSVIEAINRNEIELAERTIDAQLRNDPNSLEWNFLRGMRYYAELSARGSRKKETLAQMKTSLQKVIKIGEERLHRNPDDLTALFYAGGASGYLGLARAVEGSLFSGVRSATKGFNMHEDLIKRCPQCYDAYLGPGVMNLMTSNAPRVLKPILWLFGLSGSAEKAYDYLSIAYEKGTLVRLEAGTYLAQLFEGRKEYRKSSELYAELIRQYPMRIGLRAESATPLWIEKRYDDIIALADSTMGIFESGKYLFTRGDSVSMVSILTGCASAYGRKGDTTSAINFLEGALRKKDYETTDGWEIHYSLARLYFDQSDTTKAIAHYKEVVSADIPEKMKKHVQECINILNGSH
jgi:tetratricopeptide (TPR) repeat protein